MQPFGYVQVLTDLYEHHECLWNMKSAQYKNVLGKKKANEDIGKHFGLTLMHLFLLRDTDRRNILLSNLIYGINQ